VADKATAPETYEVPGTCRSAVDFCVDRLIEGHHEEGQLAVADKTTASESYEIRLSDANFCETSPDDEHYVDGICLPPEGADDVLPPEGANIGLEVGACVDGLEFCVRIDVAHFGDGLPPKEADVGQPPKFANNHLPDKCSKDSQPHECANKVLLPNGTNDALPPDGANDTPAVKLGFKGKRAPKNLDATREEEAKKNTTVMLGVFLHKFHNAILLSQKCPSHR
jgi:hypothetical protein